jgi:hypothetical protein
MAVVDVSMSIFDLYLLSDRVEITEHRSSSDVPLFRGDLFSLDFAAIRVSVDRWQILKARKTLLGRSQARGLYLTAHRAEIRPPIEELEF